MVVSNKKNILILSFSWLSRDPRVHRQIVFLKEHYQIIAAGFDSPTAPDVSYIPIVNPISLPATPLSKLQGLYKLKPRLLYWYLLIARRFEDFYWSHRLHKLTYQRLNGIHPDLIISNDIDTLPIALRLSSGKSKVLYDAHEYHPDQFSSLRWRLGRKVYAKYLCDRYLRQADAMTTESEGMAKEYTRNFSVPCSVITNAPFFEDLSPRPVKHNLIRMIHHGLANPSRRIENMIFLMDMLAEPFHLDLILVSNSLNLGYMKRLKNLVKKRSRVHIKPPVPMTELPRALNNYDIGLFLLYPGTLHHRLAIGNKLFEFIQARLAVAIWPSLEMARIIRKHNCGIVAKEFTLESMAKILNGLDAEDIEAYKSHSHRAAYALSAEPNRLLLLDIVRDLIGT